MFIIYFILFAIKVNNLLLSIIFCLGKLIFQIITHCSNRSDIFSYVKNIGSESVSISIEIICCTKANLWLVIVSVKP